MCAVTRNLLQRTCESLASIVDSIIFDLSGLIENEVPSPLTAQSSQGTILAETIVLMVQAMGVSIRSLNVLVQNTEMGVRDCFGIARSICELAVNISFIIFKGNRAAERARQHAAARLYRDSRRELDLAGLSFRVSRDPMIDLAEFPGLKTAVDQSTRRNGSEIAAWCEESIDDRISFVATFSQSAGRSLASARFIIHRHSSEVIHGSYYGVFYFWTAGEEKPKDGESARLLMQSHLVQCLSTVLFAVDGVSRSLSKNFGLHQQSGQVIELAKRSKNIINYGFKLNPDETENF